MIFIIQNGNCRQVQPAHQVARLRAVHPLLQAGQLHVLLFAKSQRIFVGQYLAAFTFYIFPAQFAFFNSCKHSRHFRLQITWSQYHVITCLQCLQADIPIARYAPHGKRISKNQSFKSQFIRQ